MKHRLLTILFIVLTFNAFGQSNNTWRAFWNKDSTLIGFRDKNDIVKLEPKFSPFISAKKFDDIIAVNEKGVGYYLTKTKKVIGLDSLHIFDNGYDCESEGFIRFKDKKSDQIGMFNKNGEIVIPAQYNEISRNRNGLIMALKNAKKKYLDNDEHSSCNHFSWTGGKELLIDTNNKVLIEDFKYNNNLNFYSYLVVSKPSQDPLRQNFKAIDGSYYSFIDFEKEFNTWLKTSLLNNLTKENLLKHTFEKVAWYTRRGRITENKNKFIERNFELIKSKLLETTKPSCDYSISSDGINPYTFDPKEFSDFYNNCGESKDWIYPVITLIINKRGKKQLEQDHFEFLRTENGYKLLCVSLR